jgi:putative flavoprotein involved in K+ transport
MNQLVDGDPAAMLLDVIVIGAGQAGLATGYWLRRQGLRFHLFDRAHRIGDSWRRRHDSLVLFSPRGYNSLPGLPMKGDPEGYPGKDEVGDYLNGYAYSFRLPAAMAEDILRLERREEHFVAYTSQGRQITSRAVVVATGAFQQSVVPPFASHLAPSVLQVRANLYRNPTQLPQGRVLVVGGGATGRQIALELAQTHDVCLSAGREVTITPQRLLGRDVMAWFDRLGLLRADKATAMGRFVRAHESFPGLHLRSRALKRIGVRLRPRTVGATADACVFEDRSSEMFDAVIWAIGYRDESSWLHISETADDAGNYVEDHGVSPVPGLFFVGRSWQTSRASALLCGVGDDAERVADRVATSLHHPVALTRSRTRGRAAARMESGASREIAPCPLRCSVVRERTSRCGARAVSGACREKSMEIVFETHSTSVDNEVRVASGHADVDLSPRGEREAAALGARRRGESIEMVYASDLRRSWRTAEIAFGMSSAAIVRDSRLRECDYGQLTGHPVAEIETLREQAVAEPFPGGESYRQVVLRMIPWLEEIRSRDVRRMIVVGHRATLYALEHLLLGTPLLEAVRRPFVWRPGWVYQLGGGLEHRSAVARS